MLTMKASGLFLTWMALYSATSVQGVDESCSGAIEAVTGAASVEVAGDVVLSSMSSSNGKRHTGTCGTRAHLCLRQVN